ncbi:N-acetyltransferase [Pseudoflavonifractor sp. 524-17]|uniref:GNAT family N-acetyltransferase n=1 Tax=Pseudoflavonifractor sp. 524-17 TaxID=2304577 RepID=UPI00137ABD4F|nr:GNAT family N-acetyltransferase [Pseudoflavonifractor sp. 524-17]NCE66128.1 N-acetyltransferase [Pseudoflavonifractor sp. 524-17]
MGSAGKILDTQRLYLREMDRGDFGALCKILQDEEAMYAYEGAFSDAQVWEWLDRQIARYKKWGFGLWGAVLKETGELIGQCGLTMQPWKDGEVLEIGYLFQRAFWHRGYAIEAAAACRQYAFAVLNASEVCSIIRDTNQASQKVALRNGMTPKDTWVKHYRGVDMPHCRYVAAREPLPPGETIMQQSE